MKTISGRAKVAFGSINVTLVLNTSTSDFIKMTFDIPLESPESSSNFIAFHTYMYT